MAGGYVLLGRSLETPKGLENSKSIRKWGVARERSCPVLIEGWGDELERTEY